MTKIVTLAATLQTLFTTTATSLGRLSGFIRRQRQLTAADFAQTLVFGWIDDPHSPLDSFAVQLDLSPQALYQHLGPQARSFLQMLLSHALQHIHRAQAAPRLLLQRFGAVIVEDTTTLTLPDDLADLFRGQGGSQGASRAALKILIRWELVTGQLLSLECVPAVTGDVTLAATSGDLPEPCLHLADQGFFDAGRWKALSSNQFWISRVPAPIQVAVTSSRWQTLTDWLQSLGEEGFDGWVELVQSQGLRCRLTVRRCPEEVAARRRQKLRQTLLRKKGRQPSSRQLVLCDWLVLASNVPLAQATAKELWVLYRCRWQIELLIKRGKSQLGLSFSHGRRGERVLVEILAKLLGCVVVHWQSLLRSGPLSGISAVQMFRVVRRSAQGLYARLREGLSLQPVLEKVLQEMEKLRQRPHRRKKPSTQQLLDNPELAP